uniref:Uncharacterized protein n=1 Tax=Megaselia scalaris TaxID=36166 RepID=T1GED0_MEGSC
MRGNRGAKRNLYKTKSYYRSMFCITTTCIGYETGKVYTTRNGRDKGSNLEHQDHCELTLIGEFLASPMCGASIICN